MNDTNVFTNQLSKVNLEAYYKIHVLVCVLISKWSACNFQSHMKFLCL